MITTPLDSAELDSKEQYIFYHKIVDFAVKQLIDKVGVQQILDATETQFFKQYCDLLLYSVEAMRLKYMFDDESNMKIDLTDSGFPNYLEFRYLFNDLALREQYQEKLTDVNTLKSEFLDTLLRKKQTIKRRRLYEASSIVYYTSVDQKFIFNRFVQGKVVKVDNDSEYMVSWSFYDVTHNRPFICFMYFNYGGKKIDTVKDDLYQVLKTNADREMALDMMAYSIDKKLKDVFPKTIKRIDVGPLHNVFAKDENQITHAILESIGRKEIEKEAYAFSLKIDEVTSGGDFKEGTFLNKYTLQKWNTPYTQKYVFAPHRIIQLLYNKVPEVINHLTKAPIEVGRF